jgi:valyl-tRNA synthetase
MLAALDDVIGQATRALHDFEYTTALERTERFFWSFCDDYLELVKQRAYGPSPDSARLALRSALSVLQRLLAPFLPYAAEEAWSWWHDDSVHTSPWPVPAGSGVDGGLLDVAGVVIRVIRKAKSDAKLSMKAPVDVVRVFGSQVSSVDAVRDDLLAAGNVATIELTPSDEPLRVEVSLPA